MPWLKDGLVDLSSFIRNLRKRGMKKGVLGGEGGGGKTHLCFVIIEQEGGQQSGGKT